MAEQTYPLPEESLDKLLSRLPEELREFVKENSNEFIPDLKMLKEADESELVHLIQQFWDVKNFREQAEEEFKQGIEEIKALKTQESGEEAMDQFRYMHPIFIDGYKKHNEGSTITKKGLMESLSIDEADNLLHYLLINNDPLFEKITEDYIARSDVGIKTLKTQKKILFEHWRTAQVTKEAFEVLDHAKLDPEMFPGVTRFYTERIKTLKDVIKRGLEVAVHYFEEINSEDVLRKITFPVNMQEDLLPNNGSSEQKPIEPAKKDKTFDYDYFIQEKPKEFYLYLEKVKSYCRNLESQLKLRTKLKEEQQKETPKEEFEKLARAEHFINNCEAKFKSLQQTFYDQTAKYYHEINIEDLLRTTKTVLEQVIVLIYKEKIRNTYGPFLKQTNKDYFDLLSDNFNFNVKTTKKIEYKEVSRDVNRMAFDILYSLERGKEEVINQQEERLHNELLPGEVYIDGQKTTFNMLFLEMFNVLKPKSSSK